MLEKHVILRRKPNASAENILNASALAEKGIDNGRSSRNHGRFEEIAEQGEHGIEASKVSFSF